MRSFAEIRKSYGELPADERAEDARLFAQCQRDAAAHMSLVDQLDAVRPPGTTDKAWDRALYFLTHNANRPGTRIRFKAMPHGEISARVIPPPFTYMSATHEVITENPCPLTKS